MVYGVVRIGLDAFYTSLGLRAEDVGLTQIVIISRAAMSFALVLFIGALLMMLIGGGLYSSLQRRLESSPRLQEQLEQSLKAGVLPSPVAFFYAVAWIGVVVVALSLFLSELLIEGGMVPGVTGASLLTTALTLVIGFGGAWLLFRGIGQAALNIYADEHPSPSADKRIRSFRSLIIVVAILLTAILTLVPWVAGSRIAADVKVGQPYIPRYLVGLPLFGSLDVRAECVTVRKKTDGNIVDDNIAPRQVLYLGQGDNFLVFYRPNLGPLRLPTGDFILASINETPC